MAKRLGQYRCRGWCEGQPELSVWARGRWGDRRFPPCNEPSVESLGTCGIKGWLVRGVTFHPARGGQWGRPCSRAIGDLHNRSGDEETREELRTIRNCFKGRRGRMQLPGAVACRLARAVWRQPARPMPGSG